MGKGFILGVIAVIIVLAAVIGSYFLLSNNSAQPGPVASVSTTSLQTITTTTSAAESGTSTTTTIARTIPKIPNTGGRPKSTPTAGPVSPEPQVPLQRAGTPDVATNQNVNPSNSTAVVTGTVNPNGAQTSYWYDYGQTGALGARTAASSLPGSFDTISAPGYIANLQADTLYYFRLSAANRLGVSHGATYSFRTSANPLPANPAPQPELPAASTNAAKNVATSSATLRGDINSNGADTSYWFEYSTNPLLGTSVTGILTATQSIASSTTTTVPVSADVNGLHPDTKYFYRLIGQNRLGTVFGTDVTFTTDRDHGDQ